MMVNVRELSVNKEGCLGVQITFLYILKSPNPSRIFSEKYSLYNLVRIGDNNILVSVGPFIL